MIRRLVWVFLSAALLPACADIGEPAPAPTFLLTPAAQWSGGVIHVRSLSFRTATALPVITAGPDTAATVLINDTTLAVTLPEGPSGVVDLVATVGTVPFDLGNVQRYGLSSRGDIGTDLQANLLAVDMPSGPTLLGVPSGKYNLRTVDLRNGTIVNFDSLFPPLEGANLSDLTERFALVDSSWHGGLWQLGPANQATLQVPFDTAHQFFSYQTEQAATRVSDSVWVGCGAFSSLGTSVGHPPLPHFTSNNEGDCRRLIYQTGASWALTLPGGQMVDVLTGDVAHDFGVFFFSVATASGTGSLLYAVRPDPVNGDVLVAIDPVTYGTVHSISLPVGTHPAVLAADPAGGTLYLLSVRTDTLLALSVFDGASLTPLGVLPLGERCPIDFDCQGAAIAIDLTLGRIDVVVPSVFTALSPPPSPRWTFDRLP